MLALSGLRAAGSAARRTGGELSAVYEVPVGDRRVIVKVYAEQWRWKQRKEQYVYGLLADVLGNHVPRVLDVQDETNPTGHAYTVLSLIPGEPLSEATVDVTTRRELYRQLGTLAARLHTIEQPAFGYLVTEVIDPRPTNRGYVTDRFARHLDDFRRLGGDPTLADRIADAIDENADSLDRCRGPRLVHNDLHAGNVLVESDGDRRTVRGLVDVENAIAADPLQDLAKTECYSIRGDVDDLRALLDGYGDTALSADPRFALYCVFHSLELSVWFAQTGRTGALAGLAAQAAGYLQRLH